MCKTDAPTVHTENTTFSYGFSMIPMGRTWSEVRVPPARAVVRSPAGRPWAGTMPWNCSFSQGFKMGFEKLSDFDDNYQIDLFGGHAETQGIPMVFGGSHWQPVCMCGMCKMTWNLAHSLIVRGVI